MKCFNHADRDAVGICKSCGKGICHECLVEIPDAIACKTESCERRARLCVQIVDNNFALISKSNQLVGRQGLFLLLFGVFFSGFGLLVLIFDPCSWVLYALMLGLGLLSIVHGLAMRRRKNQYPTPATEAK